MTMATPHVAFCPLRTHWLSAAPRTWALNTRAGEGAQDGKGTAGAGGWAWSRVSTRSLRQQMGGDPKRGGGVVTKERTQGKTSLTQPLAPLCPLVPTTGSMPVTVHIYGDL